MEQPDDFEPKFYETRGIDPVELAPTCHLKFIGGTLHQWWHGATELSDGQSLKVEKWFPVSGD